MRVRASIWKKMQLCALRCDTRELSLHCESKLDEQIASTGKSFAVKRVEATRAIGAYLMRTARHQRRRDLPCHRRAKVLAFYFKLLPCQPRATLKTQNKRRALRPAVY
jgi:hypothetical protein